MWECSDLPAWNSLKFPVDDSLRGKRLSLKIIWEKDTGESSTVEFSLREYFVGEFSRRKFDNEEFFAGEFSRHQKIKHHGEWICQICNSFLMHMWTLKLRLQLTYKALNIVDKPFDDKPLLFWANHLLSMPLFECRFVVAYNANLKGFKWSSSIKSLWLKESRVPWLMVQVQPC